MKVCLFLFAALICVCACSGESQSSVWAKEKEAVCLAIDSSGKQTVITDIKLYVVQGRKHFYTEEVILKHGAATLRIMFKDLAGMKYIGKKNLAEVVFYDGTSLTGEIVLVRRIKYLVATALIHNVRIPFKINIEDLKSIIQVYPPISKAAMNKLVDPEIESEAKSLEEQLIKDKKLKLPKAAVVKDIEDKIEKIKHQKSEKNSDKLNGPVK